MREIKFRGMTVPMESIPHWVYGYYTRRLTGATYPDSIETFNFNKDFIEIYATGKKMWVDPKSIGEFTGLLDSQGNEIYEGDIAKITYEEGDEHQEKIRHTEIGLMEFNKNAAQFWFSCKNSIFEDYYSGFNIEIIGNIYENPELKRDKYTCKCGKKQCTAKGREVHGKRVSLRAYVEYFEAERKTMLEDIEKPLDKAKSLEFGFLSAINEVLATINKYKGSSHGVRQKG